MLMALKMLRTKDRSFEEVRQRLIAKGHPDLEVEGVLATLAEKGYIDEQRLAERILELNPLAGPGLIEHRLGSRQLEEPTLTEVLQPVVETEAQRAEAAVQSRDPERTNPRKTAAWLARQGFHEETIRETLERLYPDPWGDQE